MRSLSVASRAGGPAVSAGGSGTIGTAGVTGVVVSCAVTSGAGTVTGLVITSISVSCQANTDSVLDSFKGGAADGALPTGSHIQATDDNFYGMTLGGATTLRTVFKITPSGTETVLHLFQGSPTDGGTLCGSFIQASDGNFHGMAKKGGASGKGTVSRFK